MRYDIATKAQAMTLKVLGASNQEIENLTGIKQRTMAYIYDRAVQRGFDPNAEHPTLRDYHFEEAPRSGRPRKQDNKPEERVVEEVQKDQSCGEAARCLYDS